jgi:Ca2+-binding RTX toxin-like protein
MDAMRAPTSIVCSLGLAGCLALAPAARAAGPSVTFAKRVLTVTGGAKANRISVLCGADGNVKMNGRNPAGGPVACGRVAEVDVLAGDGADRVDLAGVDSRFGEARFEGFGTGTGVAVLGGEGNDRLMGAAGAFNLLLGEAGDDRATAGPRRDILSGGAGDDQLEGLGRRDTLLGKAGNDTLEGGNGRDLLSGNAGDDRLFGGIGSDLLGGGPGRDRLRGGPGADTLVGGPDKDSLDGGPGHDQEFEEKPPKK